MSKNNLLKLNGLVLAGGKSTRMGIDKGSKNWHGKEQRYYLADILSKFCHEVFISCRPEQAIDAKYRFITDIYPNIGPLSGVLSAFDYNSNNAWLVVACDLPLLDETTLGYLIENRNHRKLATAYQNQDDNLPEPLLTIWEPSSYSVLLKNQANGIFGLRKILINSDIALINALDSIALMNVNSPEEMETAQKILAEKNV